MRIPKREAELKSKFMEKIKEAMPGVVALRHEDVRTAGIPDISLTWHGYTAWLEAKHGTPDFEWGGIQHLTMLRLVHEGFYVRYIIYHESARTSKHTLIVHPTQMDNELAHGAEAVFADFNGHAFIAYIRKQFK